MLGFSWRTVNHADIGNMRHKLQRLTRAVTFHVIAPPQGFRLPASAIFAGQTRIDNRCEHQVANATCTGRHGVTAASHTNSAASTARSTAMTAFRMRTRVLRDMQPPLPRVWRGFPGCKTARGMYNRESRRRGQTRFRSETVKCFIPTWRFRFVTLTSLVVKCTTVKPSCQAPPPT